MSQAAQGAFHAQQHAASTVTHDAQTAPQLPRERPYDNAISPRAHIADAATERARQLQSLRGRVIAEEAGQRQAQETAYLHQEHHLLEQLALQQCKSPQLPHDLCV